MTMTDNALASNYLNEFPESGDDSSHFGGSQSGSFAVTKEQVEKFAQKEKKIVQKLRILVLITLLCAAIAASLSIFFYLQNAETSDFEAQFHIDADKLLESFGKTIDDTLGATDAFSTNVVAYARESESVWPFVTVPNFALKASKVQKPSKAIHMATKILVSYQEAEEWKEYAANHDDWIQNSLDIQENLDDWRFPIIREYNVSYDLVGNTIDEVITEPFPYYNNTHLVQWQQAPIITGPANPIPYNRDLWAIENNVMANLMCIEEKKATMSGEFWGIVSNASDPVEAYIADLAAQWGALHLPSDLVARSREPSFSMNYPMIDSIDRVQTDITNEDQRVVGVTTFVYFFFYFLEGILPSKTKGIRIVVENECGNQTFTYQIDGPDAVYLGQWDLHEVKFDHLVHKATMGELVSSSTTQLIANIGTLKASSYSGLPLMDDFCPKTLYVYPSSVTEEEYRTYKPALFASVAALIFIFTSLVFVSYDWYVRRRQDLLQRKAAASGAIVNSLFPEQVRDKLYEEQQNRYDGKTDTFGNQFQLSQQEKVRPIAEIYEDTTVFFMDLAGFTRWSSKRTPEEVFQLLEAVYGEFDKIAAQRRVFKVETIGDCYVAVTGIPEPQKFHAEIMVKFARDAMLKFSQVVNDLAPSLGDDTAKLEMRIGLHSGPTTGGVLRGDKGRFQLFGDTVNTASRMETCGVKGKIHCSQETADALIATGKGSWLTERPDKIVAKGKGEMTTYFVHPTSSVGKQSEKSGKTSATAAMLSSIGTDVPLQLTDV